MFNKLEEVQKRFEKLESRLADPEVLANQSEYIRFAKERADLEKIVEAYREYKKIAEQIEQSESLLEDSDSEMRELARAELDEMHPKLDELSQTLKFLLLPRDPLDDKNILLEIRAGTGGEEAGLFAAELFRMYVKYAEIKRWKTEVLSFHETGIGGMKEVICSITGHKVYSKLKYESGIHRVQRVPTTETQGRIHTSAVTVAVLPEAEDIEVNLKDEDLRIDVYRSSGPGGQSVNTTDSAVRVTHIPTGLVVTCQDEKSQHKNKAQALKILKARILDREIAEQHAKMAADRKSQVGSGDRSGRIRTYNYPQNRVTDHRIGLTSYKLEQILNGEVDEFIDNLITHFQAESLKQADD